MKRYTILLIGMLLLQAFSTEAQELPLWMRYRVERSLNGPMHLKLSELQFDPSAPFAWEDKVAQEKFEQQMERYERAQKTLAPIKRHFEQSAVKITFRLRGGNTEGNWSPFPDKALDARMIRYPMHQPNFKAASRGPKAAPRR